MRSQNNGHQVAYRNLSGVDALQNELQRATVVDTEHIPPGINGAWLINVPGSALGDKCERRVADFHAVAFRALAARRPML